MDNMCITHILSTKYIKVLYTFIYFCNLDKYIADCIIVAYKSDDKSKQAFHASDVNRLTY